MLLPALLQTSLLLWLAQKTLQGGVKPQSVAYGRMLPVRGVGVGVKPGVTGALGALGSRFNTKAMKTGIGRYPAAHLGVGGYRSLGLGSRGGLRQGGYGAQGAYGASLGTGMSLGPGLTNGLGLGLGQSGKRVYGAGLGALPGYGTFAGVGYPGARQGASAADLGGPEVAGLGQAVQDLRREKSRAESHFHGTQDKTFGAQTPIRRRSGALSPTVPELHARIEVKSISPIIQSSNLRPAMPLDKRNKMFGAVASQTQRGELNERALKRKEALSHEAALEAAGVRRPRPADEDIRRMDASPTRRGSSTQENQNAEDCVSPADLSQVFEVSRFGLLGSDSQRTPGLVPELPFDKVDKRLGRTNPPSQERNFHPPSQGRGLRGLFSTGQQQGVKGPGAKDKIGLNIRVHHYAPVTPGASRTQSLGVFLTEEEQEAQVFTEGEDFSQAEKIKSKPPQIPGQTGGETQGASYLGGPGNYMGASLGAGGYGADLGQGAYLGGAAGKLGAAAALGQGGFPQGVPRKSNGYGDGVTGYLGAMGGNGFGYGNGYGDGYGAGLDYPAELADVAESKARKIEALSTGGYTGQVQGPYGALSTGLESAGGKYGAGAGQVPYGNAPVIPAGLEGNGGYPYATQQLGLGAEGAKTASKYGAAAGYGTQQTGYGTQLGATADALGEPAGKYDGVNAALGNGYKG